MPLGLPGSKVVSRPAGALGVALWGEDAARDRQQEDVEAGQARHFQMIQLE